MEPIDRAAIMGALTSSEGQAAIKAMTGEEAYNYFLFLLCSTPTIDPIRAAGGCRRGECKYWADTDDDGHGLGVCENSPGWNCHRNDFCSYGEPREVQEDG